MKKSIVLIPLPSLIKNSFVRSFSLSLSSVIHLISVRSKIDLIMLISIHDFL